LGSDRVRVRLGYWPDGVIKYAEAEGHAGTARAGENPACAAVTVLLRTAYETSVSFSGVVAHGQAAAPGSISFEIGHYPPDAAQRLRGVSDFLSIGLSGVEREYPGMVEVVREV